MKDLSYIEMNPELEKVLCHIEKGDNVTVVAPAGSGKSTLVDILAHDPKYSTEGRTVYWGSTGVATINITEKTGKKASTLHRAMSFGVEPIYHGDYYTSEKKRHFFREEVTRIVIDEIGMVGPDLMEKTLRSLLAYFGVIPDEEITETDLDKIRHIQIILLGDVLQIEAVYSREDKQRVLEDYGTQYFFGSHLYNRLNFVELPLLKVYRTDDTGYLNAMRRFRIGALTRDNLEEFSDYFHTPSEESFKRTVLPTYDTEYTTICTTNNEVREINEHWMNKIKSPYVYFRGITCGDVTYSEKIVDDELALKVGARVMIRINDPEDRFVNGTIGTILSLPSGRFLNGNSERPIKVKIDNKIVYVYSHTWEITDADGEVVGTFTQYPLSVCYALTVHKSQGNQFEFMLIKPGRGFFANGQCYTALSRSSNPKGMRLLSNINIRDVKVDTIALRWNNEIAKKGET